MNLIFTGKSVLVTGGSCDMALALADRLITEGLFPVMGYRAQGGKEKILTALSGHQGAFHTCRLDLSDLASLTSSIEALNGGPDYLVDFAQGDYECLVSSADEQRLGQYMMDNVSRRAAMLKQVSRRMIKTKFGRLVFVSSSAAGRPSPGQGLYAASKLASEALYKNIALELAPFGITSVSLRPGFVASGRGKTYLDKKQNQPIKALSASEVAQVIVFLLSDAALGFNATELVMDNGLTAGKNK